MTLDQMEALGAYLNAGHVDFWNGSRHVRLASVTAAGDVILTADGEAVAKELAPAPVEVELQTDLERLEEAHEAEERVEG
jgi:hypothetical protein